MITLFLIITFPFNSFAQDTKTTLRYIGSSTIANFIHDAEPTYEKVQFNIDTEPESAGGELAILEGRTDIAGVARKPKPTTLEKGVNSTFIGWDAIAIIINKTNPVDNLTKDQLKAIFTGQVQNWNELGGPDLVIHPCIVSTESATRKVFRSVILGEKDYAGCKTINPDVNILLEVKDDPGAIGQISFSFLGSAERIKAVAIEGQQPVLTNPEYPITRPLYILWWPGRKKITDFVEWISTPEAQSIIARRFILTKENSEKLPPPAIIKYVGSSTVGIFMQNASAIYKKTAFHINTAPESGGGEKAIAEGTTDLAGIARLPLASTLRSGIVSTLIGRDAITVIIHNNNNVKNLTLKELLGIFSGKTTNWKELGGADLPIQPYIVGAQSATRKIFRNIVLNGNEYAGCQEITPDPDIINAVKNNPGGIGHISLAFLGETDNVQAVIVEGQKPSTSNFDYPITRPLYLLWREGNPEIEAFMEWVQTPEAQGIVMQHFVGTRVVGAEGIMGEKGALIVYTKTYSIEDGGVYYYPHNSYNILSSEGVQIMRVPNHMGENDENPTKVSLPPGSYLVRPETDGEQQEFFVTIKSGKTTVVDVNQRSGKDLSTEKPGETAEIDLLGKFRLLKPYGDIRIRAEEDIKPSSERFRGRYRIRAGMNATISPSLKLDIRFVSTGNPDDPNSSHVNLNDGFNQIQIAIDRAYVKWNPQKFNQFHLWLGKFSNPFVNSSVFSELVWDADIQAEGGALAFKYKNLGPFKKVGLVNGTYLLSQFKKGNEPFLNATQLSTSIGLSDNFSISLASGLYYYTNIKDQDISTTIFDGNAGNSTYRVTKINGDTTITEHYNSNFSISDNFILFNINSLPMPLVLKGQYIHNLAADSNNFGFAAGFMYGQLKEKGNWTIYYQYQEIQQDAVFSPFVQDDVLRQTNFKSHIFGIAYAFHKKISLHAWGLLDSPNNGGGSDQTRIRLDLNIKI